MKLYRPVSLLAVVMFALVGLIFLFMPNEVLVFFNTASRYLGMPESPVQGVDLYLALAVGYMYLVTLLAYLMYRNPNNRSFPMLLANAKLATSLLSLYLFLMHQPFLIYITNCVVDGLIGLVALFFYLQIKKTEA